MIVIVNNPITVRMKLITQIVVISIHDDVEAASSTRLLYTTVTAIMLILMMMVRLLATIAMCT